MSKFFCLLIMAFLFIHSGLYANDSEPGVPTVGKPCPDFILSNLLNSNKPRISLKDFKGKWLMIDIWDANCATCIAKFPKINHFQQQFRNQLSVLLIGINDVLYDKDIKNIYLKLEKRMNLSLLAAFDTVVAKQWEVYSVPHIVLVNPEGLVYAITGGSDMDSTKIQQMIDGKNPEFKSKERKISFDEQKPLLINGNGGWDSSYLYRSVLSRYIDEDFYVPVSVNDYIEKNKAGFQIVGAPLYRLYYYAYMGQWIWGLNKDSLFETVSPDLELDIKDSSMFNWDDKHMTNFFNYSLFLPSGRRDAHSTMQALQRELKNCFGFDASVESRDVACWTLTFRKDTTVSLRSRRQQTESDFTPMSIHLKNGSIEQVRRCIGAYHQDESPFIDETGIDYPIDIQVDALLDDLPDVQQALRKNGLELLKKKRPMKVIVIRDPVAP